MKSLMELFLVIKDTSVFNNPSDSLRLTIANIIAFITRCSNLIQDYARKNFICELRKGTCITYVAHICAILLVRALMQHKKAAIENLEATLANLKGNLESAFIRQDIIETRVEAWVEISEKLRDSKFKSLV